jgi:hypothetical protein
MRRAYLGLVLALLGCDPTQGLSDTANAALPDKKRYFDGRGTQVVEGPWNRVVVDLDSDTLYHLGARRADDEQPTFHLFGTDAREGCAVKPNSGTWLMGKPKLAPYRVLPYLEDSDTDGRGRLRFTSLDCQVEDVVVENAGRPYPRLFDRGYMVPTNLGYTFVDPWQGETREIAEVLREALVWDDVVLLWADDQLKSFTDQLEAGHVWGNGVEAVVGLRDTFFAEDADGLHHVHFDRDSLEIEARSVLADACNLQFSSRFSGDGISLWAALELPCGNPKPSLARLDLATGELLDSFELPFAADARRTRPVVGSETEDGPAPLAALYLTDATDDGLGTLWAYRAGDDAPVQLGERADLDSAQLTSGEWNGVAQVNYREIGDFEAHDWIHFRWDGVVETIAERMVRNRSTGQLLINFDGVAGDLPRFVPDGVEVLVERVPPNQGEATSYSDTPRYARIDEFDGSTGRVLIGSDLNDISSWKPLASGVPPASPRFSWFMPALLFLEDWDAESETGSLIAYNYELDARAKLADGVSSFDLTRYPWDGVVYAVPNGKQRGIWFSKAK